MQTEERLKLIEKSERLIAEANELLKNAASGTQFEPSVEEIIRKIKDILNSDCAGTPENLKKNLEMISEDPIWTRPTVSVKNCDRKDI